jgi:hypothetical protein
MRSKLRAYSHQGHGPRAEQQAGYISATSDSTTSLAKDSRSIHCAGSSRSSAFGLLSISRSFKPGWSCRFFRARCQFLTIVVGHAGRPTNMPLGRANRSLGSTWLPRFPLKTEIMPTIPPRPGSPAMCAGAKNRKILPVGVDLHRRCLCQGYGTIRSASERCARCSDRQRSTKTVGLEAAASSPLSPLYYSSLSCRCCRMPPAQMGAPLQRH